MDNTLLVEPLPTLGVCNLCLTDGAVQSMFLNNTDQGTYADLLVQCFCIDLANFQLGDAKPVICECCVKQLDETMQFRKQVESSLHILEEAFKNAVAKAELEAKAELKADAMDDHLDGAFDAYLESDTLKEEKLFKDEADEQPFTTIQKFDEITSVKRLRKRSEKEPLLKRKVLQDTKTLLKNGLFPFKIKRNNSFSCAICSKKSTNLDVIKNHVTEHSIKYIHCAFTKMLNNMQRFYKNDDKLCCKLCLKYIDNYEELKSHLTSCERLFPKTGWNALPFKLDKNQTQCPICKEVFLNFVNLNSHMNEHYPNYICENCGKAFASKGRLRGHVRTHEIGEFSCKYCDLVFDKITKRENHVSKEHKSGVRYACKTCKISLPSFYARQKHLAEVHNEELKRYKCKACDQCYITPGHLSSHVRRDHLNERNHKCTKCDLAFYSRNALKMHMISHDGERIHICPVCQKSYQRKKTLREHMRIHDNDKRFICPVCGRAFTQKCTLKGHMRVHKDQAD